jgi:hypothetical protein
LSGYEDNKADNLLGHHNVCSSSTDLCAAAAAGPAATVPSWLRHAQQQQGMHWHAWQGIIVLLSTENMDAILHFVFASRSLCAIMHAAVE